MGWIIFGLFLGMVLTAAYAFMILAYNRDHNYQIKNGNGTAKKFNPAVGLILFLIPLVLFTLIASTTRVGTGEIAVMTRFGRVTGQEFSEGLHMKNPLDKANIYNIQVQKIEADAAAASKDLQDVSTKIAINYNIEPGKVSEIHRTVGELYKEKLIDPAIQESFKGATAGYTAPDLITRRAEVKGKAYDDIRNRLDKYGIRVVDLNIVNFNFSAAYNDAVEAVQVANQNVAKARQELETVKVNSEKEIQAAQGAAEAQRLQQQTLTPELLQKMEIESRNQAIAKWNGVLPTTQAGEGTNFLIQPNR